MDIGVVFFGALAVLSVVGYIGLRIYDSLKAKHKENMPV